MTTRLPFLAVLALTVGGVAHTTSERLAEADRSAAGAPDAQVAAQMSAAVSVARPETAGGSTWYCAGGDTVVVANPAGHDVKGLLTVYGGDVAAPRRAATPAVSGDRPAEGAVVERGFVLPARDRRRFHLPDLVPDASLPAAVVELSGGGVVVEQEVDGDRTTGGGDVAPCATVTASQWHLAWGDTSRGARQLVVLFNPFRRDVTVDARFSVDGGLRDPVRWQGLVVPAGRALAVDLGDDVSRQDQVSTTVRARGGHLVVSRLQSFSRRSGAGGVSLAPGVPAPAEQWVFAQGRVDGRTGERIVLYNPGQKVAEVDVALEGVEGGERGGPRPQPFGVVVRPGGFEVVDYADETRVEPGVAHATVVRSRNGTPVVAERVMTFDGSRDGDVAPEVAAGPGMPITARRWVFPALLPSEDGEARVTVLNPDRAEAVQVSVAVDHAGARSWPADLQHVEVAPGGRTTLRLPELPAAASVEVVTDRPVTAERLLVRDDQVVALTPGIPIPDA